ncbi:MAG: helix-turn-helix domain-containing protein [Cohnella sp.]|nr:helix-turn-helix domain-containing protein [Cohnella sp.]
MRQHLGLKRSSSSLFIRLIGGFIIVILLLLTFHFASFYYLKDQFRDKLVSYNQSNLHNTVDSYEDLFAATRNVLLSLYNKDEVALLHSQSMAPGTDMNQYNIKSLHTILAETIHSNPHLYLENIYLVLQRPSVIIAKEGITNADLLFSRFVGSDSLQPDFWSQQFAQNYFFRIVPASLNANNELNDTPIRTFAMIVKNRFVNDMYFIAFVNVSKAFQHLQHSFSDDMRISDAEGHSFDSPIPADVSQNLLKDNEGYLYTHNSYYFYQKAEQTGLTYVNRIPNSSIQTEISKLYWFLVPVLIAAVAISITVSVLLSMSINNPLKSIVESIQNYVTAKPIQSSITEFQRIYEHMLQANRNIQESQPMLKNYAFMNRVKSIKNDIPSTPDLDTRNDPFVFVAFQLHIRKRGEQEIAIDPEQAAYYIREYIAPMVARQYEDSLTFQIEKDMIVSLVYIGDTKRNQISRVLQAIKHTLDIDAEYCLMTIGVSSVYRQSSDLTRAFEEAQRLTKQRYLLEETQIILEETESWDFLLTAQQEQELHGYLLSANHEAALASVQRMLKQLESRKASSERYEQLAGQIINKGKQAIHSLRLDENPLDTLALELAHCITYADYEKLLTQVVHTTADQVQARKEVKDPLITFVSDYLDAHYREDVSLDLVADRLKITSGYLSTYFKEATGVNFKDYLTKIRMEEAKRLLVDTDLKVQTISEQVGYPNITPFIRMFRKYTGTTPGEYRKQILTPG